MYKYFFKVFFSLMLAACSGDGSEETKKNDDSSSETADGDLQVETIAENLDAPWMIENSDDGFYISGRDGELSLITGEGQENQPLNLSVPVAADSESGLLGFFLHPEDTSKAFMYYTYEDGGKKNRVVELTRENDGWRESDAIVEDIPGGAIHNGGRLEIGPDGYLYITTGDAGDEEMSQNTASLAGKILRVKLDGTVPEGNPFGNEVFTYGHRNPQGITWDEEGNMYAAEHGSSAHDEINRIEKGNNYGWPVIRGDEESENMETPLYHTGEETWAPSGIDYYDGRLFIAALAGEKIIEYDIESGEANHFYDEESRFRDVYIEDGALYAITNNTDGRGTPREEDDRLIKIELE